MEIKTEFKDTKPSQVLSGFKITEFILQNLKKELIVAKFKQDLLIEIYFTEKVVLKVKTKSNDIQYKY